MADWTPPATDKVVSSVSAAWTPPATDRVVSRETSPDALPWYQRVGHGLMDVVRGGAQIGARMDEPSSFASTDPTLAQRVDTEAKQAEQSYQAKRKAAGQSGIDWWRMAGDIAGSTAANPLTYVPGLGATTLGKLGVEAAAGAIGAAQEPVTQKGDFWSQKAKQITTGTLVGPAGGSVVRGVGKTIAPAIGSAARTLAEKGVQMTPGQLLAEQGIGGRTVRTAESALRSFPILGSFIRNSEEHSVESFDRSVINQALEPIGEKLGKDTKVGTDSVRDASEKIGAAYDRLFPKMTFYVDRDFIRDMGQLRTLAHEMPPPQAAQFEQILENRLMQRLASNSNVLIHGTSMDGQTLKQVESELGNMAAAYRSSSDAAQRQLGTALDETRSLMRQALERGNPDEAAELRNINSAYAMLVRVENAATRRAGSDGVFSPMDLLSAIRGADRSVRHREFSHGDALLQTYAQAGQKVLPQKIGDSGTTERGLWDLVLGTGLWTHRPEVLAPLAAIPAYTERGGAAVQNYLMPGATRQGIGRNLSILNQIGAGAAGAEAAR